MACSSATSKVENSVQVLSRLLKFVNDWTKTTNHNAVEIEKRKGKSHYKSGSVNAALSEKKESESNVHNKDMVDKNQDHCTKTFLVVIEPP